MRTLLTLAAVGFLAHLWVTAGAGALGPLLLVGLLVMAVGRIVRPRRRRR